MVFRWEKFVAQFSPLFVINLIYVCTEIGKKVGLKPGRARKRINAT